MTSADNNAEYTEGNGLAEDHPDDKADLDTTEVEADLSGDPVPDISNDDVDVSDELVADNRDTTEPETS